MSDFNLKTLRLTTELPRTDSRPRLNDPCLKSIPFLRQIGRQTFLRGPIPWFWLTRAATANARGRGRALHVAIVLWQMAGYGRSATVDLSLSGTRMREMGLDRWAARRGLLALQKIGVVDVRSRRGRKILVTILDAPAANATREPKS